MSKLGPLTDRLFSSFEELSTSTVEYLLDHGFRFATPVQAAVLPVFSRNKDVVVDACTGSGKTLAFLLPILEKLNKINTQFRKHNVAMMVISPTRELASQTFKVAKPLFQNLTPFSILRLVGGSEVVADLKEIEAIGGNVIIGTPGRISDIMKRTKTLNFNSLEVLVLDEADRLLDLGFEIQLLEIIHSLPKQRRTGLFSATQDEACENLIKAGLRNPLRINVTTTTLSSENRRISDLNLRTPQSLSLSAVILPANQKLNQLISFLLSHPKDKIIVYGLTCACVEYWFYTLKKLDSLKGLTIRSLHGKMGHNGREKAIESFKNDQRGILLATDVAARGLDIPEVHWVIQMDAPQDPRAFIHRVGRTARMGQTGDALIYLTPAEEPYIKFLQMKQVPVEVTSAIESCEDCIPWLRSLSETDRDAMMKGVTAFTSYIRAYSNHYCPYIFRVKDLNLGQLAYSFGLLYLPGMKEIKVKKEIEFIPSKVDPISVKFCNKSREEDRQRWIAKRLEEKKQQKQNGTSGKKTKKKKKGKEQVSDIFEKSKRTRNQRKRDLEELEEDYKMYKLEKKQKRKETEEARVSAPPDDELEDSIQYHQPKVQPNLQKITTTTSVDPGLRQSLREKLNSMQKQRRRKHCKGWKC